MDSTRPAYWDIEVSTLSDMLEKGMWSPTETATIKRQLEDRKAQILAGLGNPTQIYWTMKVQRDVDPDCRVRRDPIHGWMLDRWVSEIHCWHPVGYIGSGGRLEDDSREKVIEDVVRPDLIHFLQSHDMQRKGYLEEKAAAAAAIREENEEKATNKVLAAVDSLSTKRLTEFIQVEKAIQTGETVTMHGETLRQFNKMTEAGKKAPPGPMSINPGLHPQVHTRDYSKGEGEEYGK